jgi:hypothetical protein
VDPVELEYFEKRFNTLGSKIEGAKEEVQSVKTDLVDRLGKHKNELIDRIDVVRSEVRQNSVESNSRWAAMHEELSIHKTAACPDVKEHERNSHNFPKIVGILLGVMTIASILATGLVWLIGKMQIGG